MKKLTMAMTLAPMMAFVTLCEAIAGVSLVLDGYAVDRVGSYEGAICYGHWKFESTPDAKESLTIPELAGLGYNGDVVMARVDDCDILKEFRCMDALYSLSITGCAMLSRVQILYPTKTTLRIKDCWSLKSLDLPGGENVYVEYCDSLQDVKVSNVSGVMTLSNCEKLKNITLLNVSGVSITKCDSLDRLVLPEGVVKVERIRSCKTLRAVYFYGKLPDNLGDTSFNGCPDDLVVYCTRGKGWPEPSDGNWWGRKHAYFTPVPSPERNGGRLMRVDGA